PLHQGSDGAGSIRMPSHFCGIFGLKPTYGRVPSYPVSNNDYTSHVGPMTRSVADAALILEAVAGPHPLDHTSLEAPPADYSRRAIAAGALAAASLGLALLGGVLLPVQPVRQSGGDRALRFHPRGPAGRPADRRPAVRRPRRAAGSRGVRGGATLGGPAAEAR